MERNILVRLLTLAVLSLVVQGCAAVAPILPSLTGGSAPGGGLQFHSQTVVNLETGNYVTVRTNVVGRSKGFKLLGFITIVPATLDKAMDRMYAAAEVQSGRPQTFAHLMVEQSGVYVILFSIPKVTARADLIEFLPQERSENNQAESMGIQRPTGWRPVSGSGSEPAR